MRVLEVNVDDLHMGGVYSLVKNIIVNNKTNIKIDIGAIEKFVNIQNIKMLKRYNCDVYYIGFEGSKWKKQFICYSRLKRLLQNQRYDCVHIHADVSNKLLVSGLAAKHAGIKKIILHSHAAGVDGNHRGFKVLFHRVCRRLLKCIGTDYVACSDLAAKWMFPNIRIENIKIINNGIDLDKFRYDPEKRIDVRRKLGFEENIILGHVGRFAYQKNHEYLLQIMERVKKNNSNVKLLLIGEGPEEKRIRFLVHEKKLDNVVLFYGISDAVNDLFQAIDIFLLPSHFEGLPIVGVEAQAAGLPVLFSNHITRNAKIIKPVEFLDIAENNIGEWIDRIQEYMHYKRVDTYQELKSHMFSIDNTIDSFMDLYK